MRAPDETDLEILELLLSDARRPYSEIADVVGLSAPAVSDRVSKLKELGIIERFTVDVDMSQLRKGIPVLVTVHVTTDRTPIATVRDVLLDEGAVEHVFTTAEADLVIAARVPDADVAGWLDQALDTEEIAAETIREVSVTLLSASDWSPDPAGTEFALTCTECGNTVDSEGTATRIDGTLYQFCCASCEARFEAQHERLREGAD